MRARRLHTESGLHTDPGCHTDPGFHTEPVDICPTAG